MSIHERPKEADGTRFGDWEMDLIVDARQNAILILTENVYLRPGTTKLGLLVKMGGEIFVKADI